MHKTWYGMRQRCERPTHHAYALYGRRGIKVCERWRSGDGTKSGVECFAADMGPKPTPAHSLDRIDNDGDYEPANCRWATRAQQSANLRSNRKLTAFGQTHHLLEWSRRTGIGWTTIRERLCRGWTAERALTVAPVDPAHAAPGITWRGQIKPIRVWARELGIGRNTLKRRIRMGLPLDGASQG